MSCIPTLLVRAWLVALGFSLRRSNPSASSPAIPMSPLLRQGPCQRCTPQQSQVAPTIRRSIFRVLEPTALLERRRVPSSVVDHAGMLGSAAACGILDLLAARPGVADSPRTADGTALTPIVTFEDVKFAYPGARRIGFRPYLQASGRRGLYRCGTACAWCRGECSRTPFV